MDILFLFPLKDHHEQRLKEAFPDVNFLFDRKPDDPAIGTSEVIVTYGADLDAAHIEKAEALKWLMVASAGLEQLPQEEISKRGITVTNVRGIHKTPMAESILAHILSGKRGLKRIYEQQASREWSKKTGSRELRGSTALILGPGAIGGEAGRLLQAFGVKTYGCNRSGRKADYMDEMLSFEGLTDVLPEMDFIISVLPSTPETRGLLNKEHFLSMKDTAVFLNFGRGDLYDEQHLIDALNEGRPAAAVLDVFETEPLPEDHPFWGMDQVTVSPHASSLSGKYVDRSLDIFIPNLKLWLEGKAGDMDNLIDTERGY
ncbi:D-2-hydroxyacid dehydrogenase [Edaphobacillus lindanitolerans]|uniref:Phosphoglycerate dehydrogenase n=1 Tax=Edaphobacillus lindanitolerans TaxID=550447 RepID=A0A1U7PU47_9BACI|nr:D-2-hydroxyacid dehydrogenase [Edaphobacillus lindanitolerans]SIT93217.1 Phosphoglycerate dehydrogenase [Edaphobacillus lindanitolerans]